MSINSKMTALADEIRELSGTTTPKSIDAMTSDVDAANTEIAEQTELLEQIVNALEGKVAGSGSGGSNMAVIQPLEVTKNGTYTAPAMVDGYSPVIVNVAGSGSASYDTCTVQILTNDGSLIPKVAYTTVDSEGNVTGVLASDNSSSYRLTCLCNSVLVVEVPSSFQTFVNEMNVTRLGFIRQAYTAWAFMVSAPKDGEATIMLISVGGGGVM